MLSRIGFCHLAGILEVYRRVVKRLPSSHNIATYVHSSRMLHSVLLKSFKTLVACRNGLMPNRLGWNAWHRCALFRRWTISTTPQRVLRRTACAILSGHSQPQCSPRCQCCWHAKSHPLWPKILSAGSWTTYEPSVQTHWLWADLLMVWTSICPSNGTPENGFETIAVLPMDSIHSTLMPHWDTAKQMLIQGGLLTEYATNTNADKQNLCAETVSLLAWVTLVLSWKVPHGGALITARLSNEYNRDVFAFPGAVGRLQVRAVITTSLKRRTKNYERTKGFSTFVACRATTG